MFFEVISAAQESEEKHSKLSKGPCNMYQSHLRKRKNEQPYQILITGFYLRGHSSTTFAFSSVLYRYSTYGNNNHYLYCTAGA